MSPTAPAGSAWGPWLAALILLSLVPAIAAAGEGRTLADVEAQVARDHAGVAQLAPADFAGLRESGKPFVIFDTREEAEYRVSRIADAVRIDPRMAPRLFLTEHGAKVAGQSVVFYCSVGVRSSRLADVVGSALRQRGARAVYNLTGGIFRWHNEGRPLVDEEGPTPLVHPYDATWGKLLRHSN